MARGIRLGVFVNDLLSPYQIRLFNSLKRAAEANDVRLLGFQGSFLANEDREKRKAFAADKGLVESILKSGANRANAAAEETMEQVRRAIKLK